MAKVPFSKLGCKVNTDIKQFEFNGQTIEVKQYIPFNDMLVVIAAIINECQDDNNFKNDAKIDCFSVLEIIKYFTNISFTDKQLEDPGKLYDLIYCSGLWEAIYDEMPQGLYEGIVGYVNSIFNNIYEYRTSAYAILDSLKVDYDTLDYNASDIQSKLSKGENVEFLKDVLNKLG